MIRRSAIMIVALGTLLAGVEAVGAQSVGTPAGIDPATAPGGTEGIAGPRNEVEAIRSGDAVPVPPRTDGIPVDDRGIRPGDALSAPGTR